MDYSLDDESSNSTNHIGSEYIQFRMWTGVETWEKTKKHYKINMIQSTWWKNKNEKYQ